MTSVIDALSEGERIFNAIIEAWPTSKVSLEMNPSKFLFNLMKTAIEVAVVQMILRDRFGPCGEVMECRVTRNAEQFFEGL